MPDIEEAVEPKAKDKYTEQNVDEAFSIRKDVVMLEQIKDVQDELHVLEMLIGDQHSVIDQFCKLIEVDNHVSRAYRTVLQYQQQVKKMSDHARDTYEAVRVAQTVTTRDTLLTSYGCPTRLI